MLNWPFPKISGDGHALRQVRGFVPSPSKHEGFIVLLLCIIAAIRTFFFIAAFPFFCNVDEQAQLDTVIKYSRGYLPHKENVLYEPEAVDLIVRYETPEYCNRPDHFKNKTIPPPLCLYTKDSASLHIKIRTGYLEGAYNHEAFSPPVYYAISGIWYNIGKCLGVRGVNLLYWVRFFNIPVVALLVWLSYIMARQFYPDDRVLRTGLPVLIAFFPQDVFYSINNDVLSPLLFGIAFYLLLQLLFSNYYSCKFSFFTGVFIAISFLTKFSNFPIIIIAVLIFFIKMRRSDNKNVLFANLSKILPMLMLTAVPAILWLSRNRIFLGDAPGTADKMKYLRWSIKPLNAIFSHPIFSIKGMIIFWYDLMGTFWRGEFVWHLSRLASRSADIFYSLSSFVFIMAAAIDSILPRNHSSQNERFVTNVSFLAFLFFLFFLVGMSVLFDFGDCFYPSRIYPYCTSGRLILGMLIPFFILYVKGLTVILTIFKKFLNPLVIISAIVIFITWSEISITHPVFVSKYNWFHIHGY